MHRKIKGMHIKREIYPSQEDQHQLHHFSLQKRHQENHQQRHKENSQHITSVYFITSTSKEECIEDYIANIIYKLYLLYVKPDEVDVNVQGEKLNVDTVKDTISPFELHFTLMSFISVFVESIQEDEFSKQTTGADDIKKDATQRGTFS